MKAVKELLANAFIFPDVPYVKKGLKAERPGIRWILICGQMEVVVTTAIRQGSTTGEGHTNCNYSVSEAKPSTKILAAEQRTHR